jgi:hypothetical protein
MHGRITGMLAMALLAATPALALSALGAPPGLDFLSPVPGATQILPEANIIIRPGGVVDPSTVAPGLLRVRGSLSGLHDGRLQISDDRQTLTFQPDAPFLPAEQVICRIGVGLRTDSRGTILPAEFAFTVAGPERNNLLDPPALSEIDDAESAGSGAGGAGVGGWLPLLPPPPSDSIPADFPRIQASVAGTTAPGRLFLSNFSLGTTTVPYLMILENDGRPFFQRKLAAPALDFKMQPDGRLTYYDTSAKCFYALNALYAVVDSFRCGNGYSTDGHDLLLLPNGHALLMSYDPELMDLDPTKPGLAFGVVIGLIIQELDRQKNVVFQWRSWDHFKISDATVRITFGGGLDYVHGNSLDVDPSGNIILSCRHMDEVTKISRATGEILWRLGGKNNQFAFLNDPLPFSHQHAVRSLPNGHLALFDNGNLHVPHFSRAMEYAIDEGQKTATVAWQYRLNPDVFGPAFGYVQRFANGNTLICWGATTPTLTEVAPDGSIASELTLDPGIATYRAVRFEWPPVRPVHVTFIPSSIDAGCLGTWLMAAIEPDSSSFAVSDIVLSSVRLNGTVPADQAMFSRGDLDGDGIPDLAVRFARAAVQPLLAPGTNRLEVSASLRTGEVVRGSADLRVVPTTGTSASAVAPGGSLRLVSPIGALPVEIASNGRQASLARTLAVYDVMGRLVRRWRAAVPAGARASWDGRRADGRPVSAGIYLVRAEDGTPSPALKVVVAR